VLNIITVFPVSLYCEQEQKEHEFSDLVATPLGNREVDSSSKFHAHGQQIYLTSLNYFIFLHEKLLLFKVADHDTSLTSAFPKVIQS
jgi:hypothetical protein